MTRAAMFVLALLFAGVSARAQHATVVRVSSPDAAIGAVGWSTPGAPARPAPRQRLSVEYREPRGVGLPARNEPPDDALRLPTEQELEHRRLARAPRKRRDAAQFTLEIENKSEKAIKAVEWDISLVGRDGAASHSFRFRTESSVAPRESATHTHALAADDRWRSFTRDARTRGSRVVVTMLAVSYADGTEWRRG